MGNACLVRDETAYLTTKDFFSIAERDGVVSRVEGLVEDVLIQVCASIYKVCDVSTNTIYRAKKYKRCCNEQSLDPYVYLPSGS